MEITKLDLLAITTSIMVFGPMWWEGIQVMLSW